MIIKTPSDQCGLCMKLHRLFYFCLFFYLHSTSGYEELLRHVYSNKTMLVLGGGLGCLWM